MSATFIARPLTKIFYVVGHTAASGVEWDGDVADMTEEEKLALIQVVNRQQNSVRKHLTSIGAFNCHQRCSAWPWTFALCLLLTVVLTDIRIRSAAFAHQQQGAHRPGVSVL